MWPAHPPHRDLALSSIAQNEEQALNKCSRVTTSCGVYPPRHNTDVHTCHGEHRNTTSGWCPSLRLPDSRKAMYHHHCPTLSHRALPNNRTVRVRGGSLMVESTSSHRSPTDLLEGMSKPRAERRRYQRLQPGRERRMVHFRCSAKAAANVRWRC